MTIDLRPWQERKSKKSAAKAKVPEKIKQYVKYEIERTSEDKEATPLTADDVAILPYGLQTTHTFTTLNLNQIFQGITQGSLNGQRLGDEIRVKKLTFKGFINWDSSRINNSSYLHIPLYVKMFVFRRRDTLDNPAQYAGLTGTGENTILMNGPTATNPFNKLSDFNKPFNTNVYKIYATRTFKLGPAAVGDTPQSSGQYNNDFSFSERFSINLSKHVGKIKYSDGQVYQQNAAFYVGFLVAFANNHPIDVQDQPPVEIHYTTNMTYEDA